MMGTSKFLALPAELKNQIYSEIFRVNEFRRRIFLLDAEPPSGAILLACRTTFQDAAAMHKAACTKFWRTQPFFIDAWALTDNDRTQLRSRHLSETEHLDLVMHTSVLARTGYEGIKTVTVGFSLLDKRGVWQNLSILNDNIFPPTRYRALAPFPPGFSEIQTLQNPADRKDDGVLMRKVKRRQQAERICGSLERHAPMRAQVLYLLEWFERFCRRYKLTKLEYEARYSKSDGM